MAWRRAPWVGEPISSSCSVNCCAAGEPEATASLARSSMSSRGCLAGVMILPSGFSTGGNDSREPYLDSVRIRGGLEVESGLRLGLRGGVEAGAC